VHGAFHDQLYADGRRQVKDDVALIDQLGGYRLVMYALDGVMKARVVLQMANVFEATGGQIVDDKYFVAAL
jgi:hypothetical protein